MRIALDDRATRIVLNLLGVLKHNAKAHAGAMAPLPDVARGFEAQANLVLALEALLRAREVGITDDERRLRELAVDALGDQLAAFGEESACGPG